MPAPDAVLLPPQPITFGTETAATPSDVPSRTIAPADTAFGHVTALSVTPLPESLGDRIDNMGISSHSHSSNLVHGDPIQDVNVTGNMSDRRTSAENNNGVPSQNRAASKAPEAAAEGEQQQLQDVMSKDEQQDVSSGPDRADAIVVESVKLAHRCSSHLSASVSDCSCSCLLEPTDPRTTLQYLLAHGWYGCWWVPLLDSTDAVFCTMPDTLRLLLTVVKQVTACHIRPT